MCVCVCVCVCVYIYIYIYTHIHTILHTESSVGIANRYGLYRPGIESRWRRDRPWCPPSLLYNGYWAIPGSKAAGSWR